MRALGGDACVFRLGSCGRQASSDKPEIEPRALPWSDVRRYLRAINRKTRTGPRKYALLLMMAAYGLGSGEVLRLTLDSLDWRRRHVCVIRPKTGREILLPLLPGVARRGRLPQIRPPSPLHEQSPLCANERTVQLSPLGGGHPTYAAHARDVRRRIAAFLGSHALRHSHACRQIDQGAPVTVVGDILGHRRPESTSVYVRVALHRLRAVSLPVPR